MTKKIFAILMALVLTLSLSAVAFASSETPITKVDKTWVDENGNVITVHPQEQLEFNVITKSVEDNSDASYSTSANIPDITLIKPANSEEFVIGGTDALNGVGKFTYTMKEKKGDTAGVTYDIDNVTFTVSVVKRYVVDQNNVPTTTIETLTSLYAKNDDGTKVYAIKNKYEDGTLKVVKNVTGNMASGQDTFPVTVTFTSSKPVGTTITGPNGNVISLTKDQTSGMYIATDSITVTASNSDGYTYQGIASGISVNVKETDLKGYDSVAYALNGTTNANASADSGINVTISTADDVVTITNTKGADVDTGITMDSIPYVVLLAVAVFGIVALMMKKRFEA